MRREYYRLIEIEEESPEFNTKVYHLTLSGIEEPNCHIVALESMDGRDPHTLEDNDVFYAVNFSMYELGGNTIVSVYTSGPGTAIPVV